MPYGQYVTGVHNDIQVSLLESSVREIGGQGSAADVDVLDAEFFDEETLILVYRAKETQGKESTFCCIQLHVLTRIIVIKARYSSLR